ncbi:hypothetical protein HHI36_009697 [Cryptolaemus montrouzieri]|uniref:GIY-YIG domain-containing protein n=1 Tax=Cryptolaemus montrouzieri TaxID=559131 RepID=A0ABD2MGL3_9CUCU
MDNIEIAKKVINSIEEKIFSKTKSENPKGRTLHVIYKIQCGVCDGIYVAQTGRWLETRIGEHKNDCRDGKEKSGLSQHVIQTGHRMKFEEAENNDSKIVFLEAVKIGEFLNSIKIQTDSRSISTFYCNILNEIKGKEDVKGRLYQHNNVT